MARQDANPSEPPTESEPISEAPQSLRAPRTTDPDGAPLTPRSLPSDPTELDLKHPGSSVRPAPKQPGDPDTMISAPRPAEREELEMADRFRMLEDRIDELDARVRMLAQKRQEPPLAPAQPWWIWLIFLLGLAITWQLLQALR
ncbi:MAG TPA: hypothetical protein VM686_12355 [Polyangiaceae bacterium]|nr:hypothetical protein [Polyangiaceae bacterium]